MSTTKGFLQQLVRTGQLRCVPVSEWHVLTGKQRELLIRQARNTPPLTYSPVSLECKNLLRSYHAQGLLPDFHPEDLKELTALEADFLIRCAGDNRWLTKKSLFDYYRQTDIDTAPADPEQLSRIIKLGKKCDFECHQMEHQISAYTNCSHGCGLAVLHPVYYRHIYKYGLKKFVRFAENVWQIRRGDMTDEALAEAGVNALADFIREIGLPTSLKELGVTEDIDLREIADSCNLSVGSYKKMTHEEILEIFRECI